MTRGLCLLILAAVVLSIPLSHLVVGKAHVRIGMVQVCHKGEVITISEKALRSHLAHGDCQLPACDFNNVFQTEDPCSGVDADGDLRCDLDLPRDSAEGLTEACPEGSF